MNINSFIQDIVMGVVLALAVGFDCIQEEEDRQLSNSSSV